MAAAAVSACSGGTDDPADAGTEIIDPAAAVAASEIRAQDVVAPPTSGGTDGRGDGSDSGGETDPDEIDPLSIRGEIDPLSIRGEIISEYNLVEGECFNRVEGLQAGRRVTITARVECAEPHFAEVFHTFELDVAHPANYPGDEATTNYAVRTCYDHFEAFVGMSYELSLYEIGVFTPNRTNFEDDRARYRGVHCWLHPINGEPLTGTAQDSAR